MNEGLNKDYSLMRWVVIYGAMLIIALLFGSVPVFISYRRVMDAPPG